MMFGVVGYCSREKQTVKREGRHQSTGHISHCSFRKEGLTARRSGGQEASTVPTTPLQPLPLALVTVGSGQALAVHSKEAGVSTLSCIRYSREVDFGLPGQGFGGSDSLVSLPWIIYSIGLLSDRGPFFWDPHSSARTTQAG